MLFLHRRAVTGAHRALFLPTTFPDADTPHRGMRKASLVVNELKCVEGSLGAKFVPRRRLSVIRQGSTIFPGFILPCGSQTVLNSRKASQISGPNIFGRNSAF